MYCMSMTYMYMYMVMHQVYAEHYRSVYVVQLYKHNGYGYLHVSEVLLIKSGDLCKSSSGVQEWLLESEGYNTSEWLTWLTCIGNRCTIVIFSGDIPSVIAWSMAQLGG